VTSRKTEKGK